MIKDWKLVKDGVCQLTGLFDEYDAEAFKTVMENNEILPIKFSQLRKSIDSMSGEISKLSSKLQETIGIGNNVVDKFDKKLDEKYERLNNLVGQVKESNERLKQDSNHEMESILQRLSALEKENQELRLLVNKKESRVSEAALPNKSIGEEFLGEFSNHIMLKNSRSKSGQLQ